MSNNSKKTDRSKKQSAKAAENKKGAPAVKRGAPPDAESEKPKYKRLRAPFSKKPKKRKNVSQNISNGTLIITNDKFLYGTDGQSDKTRMAPVIDSNRADELALVKYTTSTKHGREFENNKGFKGHGDKIYTLDNEGKPIKIDDKKFVAPRNSRRNITEQQANEIKRRNVEESKYKAGNKANLRNLKHRKKKK